MKTILIALVAVAVASVMLSAGFAIADSHDDEEQMASAGGGGWFLAKNASGAIFKDTFGFYLDPNDLNMSSLVLQARDAGARVHAYHFEKILISDEDGDGNWTAEAWGNATGAGMDWSFYLSVTDCGNRKMDALVLEVTLADDPSVSLTWKANGLGGGQIWVIGE